ncbi:MAG: division/cell wall cluster transcriptional repressor MraZ, partial [Anaerolineae bacterium]|nr:division/cell wall cluster transcriptional repressor MraZ [Anaerolineae bacterium]
RLDKQGRLLIPPSLRKHAEIEPDSEIVVVGINAKTPHLEVWNKQRWNGVQNALESESDEWSEELARHGFNLR